MAYALFCDSFETWTTVNPSRWTVLSNSVPTASVGRRGSAALRQNGNTIGGATAVVPIEASTHCVIGFAFNMSRPNSYNAFFFRNGATNLVSVYLDGNNKFTVTLGGTVYTSSSTYISGSWVYIEIGVEIGDIGSLEVRVNGSSAGWLSLSSVDTKPGTLTHIDNISLVTETTASGTHYTYLDDLYITYGDELKWLGDIRVDALALTANSTPQDWTPDTGNAWERLNNASTGYITGTTLGDESLFTLADYTPATTAIHGVQVCAYARKTDAGSRSMAIEVKSGSTAAVGSTIALSDSAVEYRRTWTTDPNTSSVWTDVGVDALEIGVKVMD